MTTPLEQIANLETVRGIAETMIASIATETRLDFVIVACIEVAVRAYKLQHPGVSTVAALTAIAGLVDAINQGEEMEASRVPS